MNGAVLLDSRTGRPEAAPGQRATFQVRERLGDSAAGREILRLLDRAHENPGPRAIDPYANFSYSAVNNGSTIIGSTGTPKTIILNTGDGQAFPGGDGVTQFNIVVWPANTRPLVANAEIVRVTRTLDTLTTVARAQEGSAARANIAAGDQVMAAVSVKVLTDLAFESSEAGADQASAATVTLSQPFTGITGVATVTNIALASWLVPKKGWRVTLWFESGPIIVQNNGGGTGNILTSSGSDATFLANTIVTFRYDGASWRQEGGAGGAITATTVAGLGTGTQGKIGLLRLMPATYNAGGSTALPAATITVGDTTEFPSAGTFTTPNGTITYTGKTATTFTGCTGGSGTLAANAAVVLATGTPVNSSYEYVTLIYDATLGKWVSPVTAFYGSSTSYVVSSAAFAEVGAAAAVAQAQPRIAWRKYDAAGLKPQLKWSLGWALNTVTPVGFTACPSFWGQDITVAMAGAAASIGPDTAAAGYVGPSSNGSMPYETLWGNIPGGYTLRDFLLLSLQAKVSAGNALVGGGDKLDAFLRWVG